MRLLGAMLVVLGAAVPAWTQSRRAATTRAAESDIRAAELARRNARALLASREGRW
jgi:hypothetical protein